ncbi:hypothetical protein ACGFYQ_34755 [Streptomyces sp. NPDC048258]|uniref:hypothetical protein n=1 Tax=Streptomyces sp. NPDC048258 TaxID=3365527 RepID=UPI003716F7E1
MLEVNGVAAPIPALATAVDYGTVPDWIAGVGSAVATVLLAVGLLREIRLRRIDGERAATERRAAEANQARLIGMVFRVRGSGTRVEFVIRNDSDEPLRDPAPLLFWADQGDALYIPRVEAEPAVVLLGPRQKAELIVSLGDGAAQPPHPSLVRCAVAFTDANGRRWLRTGAGRPLLVLDGDLQTLERSVRAAEQPSA